METSYITSATSPEQLPDYPWPEIAFLGRSNCGKSSLLNALLGRKNLARTSSTPGRTQMVNFFSVKVNKNSSFIFVDLPGWGYHETTHKIQKSWKDLLDSYVERLTIRDFLFLIDIRRDLEESEIEYLAYLAAKTSLIIVLTKTDKVNQQTTQNKIKELKLLISEKQIVVKNIFPVSSTKKTGIEELQKYILRSEEPVSQ